MERLTWMLTGMLRTAARLLPPGRREWTEAVRAEAGQVPAGWPRLGWLAAGAVCGLVLTNFFAVAFFMMVLGPLLGAAGGAVAADHPRKPRPARSWAAGLFVRS